MPPKNSNKAQNSSSSPEQKGDQKKDTSKERQSEANEGGKGTKRKQPAKADSHPNKASRRSNRNIVKDSTHASAEQVLKFLLSDDSLQYCQPPVDDKNKQSADDKESSPRLYTSQATALNPFEELMSAAILSRPISHRLGHRTIRTVLNKPYEFTSAKAVRDAGREKVSQALWDARTQHKEKTAQEIWDLATTVLDEYADGDEKGESLEGLRKKSGKAMDEEKLELQNIKGIGKTGLDIFFRRIQSSWEEVYPFVDDRTASALESLGLPPDATHLDQFLEKQGHEGDRKKVFTLVLERAVGANLEGNIDVLLKEATA